MKEVYNTQRKSQKKNAFHSELKKKFKKLKKA